MDEIKTNTDKKSSEQSQVMRWISFIVITLFFAASATKAIIGDHETDRTLAGLFLVVTGFAWGANIWKFFIGKITK